MTRGPFYAVMDGEIVTDRIHAIRGQSIPQLCRELTDRGIHKAIIGSSGIPLFDVRYDVRNKRWERAVPFAMMKPCGWTPIEDTDGTVPRPRGPPKLDFDYNTYPITAEDD